MKCFSDKNSVGTPAQLTVYGAIFKALDYDTGDFVRTADGKIDKEKQAPFKPRTLSVRPFADEDRGDVWGRQSFAWQYTGTKCTTSAQLASALQDHWVCKETEGRILVSVTDAGSVPLNKGFNEHELYAMSKLGGVYTTLTPCHWYGDGATDLPEATEQKRKQRRLRY